MTMKSLCTPSSLDLTGLAIRILEAAEVVLGFDHLMVRTGSTPSSLDLTSLVVRIGSTPSLMAYCYLVSIAGWQIIISDLTAACLELDSTKMI